MVASTVDRDDGDLRRLGRDEDAAVLGRQDEGRVGVWGSHRIHEAFALGQMRTVVLALRLRHALHRADTIAYLGGGRELVLEQGLEFLHRVLDGGLVLLGELIGTVFDVHRLVDSTALITQRSRCRAHPTGSNGTTPRGQIRVCCRCQEYYRRLDRTPLAQFCELQISSYPCRCWVSYAHLVVVTFSIVGTYVFIPIS